MKDLKILIITLVFSTILIVGLAFLLGGKSGEDESATNRTVEGVEANPEFYDLGEVPIKGGIVTKEYEIKNTSNVAIKT